MFDKGVSRCDLSHISHCIVPSPQQYKSPRSPLLLRIATVSPFLPSNPITVYVPVRTPPSPSPSPSPDQTTSNNGCRRLKEDVTRWHTSQLSFSCHSTNPVIRLRRPPTDNFLAGSSKCCPYFGMRRFSVQRPHIRV